MTSIAEQLDKLRPDIMRIASTRMIGADSNDMRIVMACVQYVAARQVANEVLERSV